MRPAPAIVGAFFAVSSAILLAAAATVLVPGTPLDAIWAIKPAAGTQLCALAPWSGVGFLVLAVVMATASLGAFRRTSWAWPLAIGIFAVNGLSDAARIPFGGALEGLVEVVAAALILCGLSRRGVRAQFR